MRKVSHVSTDWNERERTAACTSSPTPGRPLTTSAPTDSIRASRRRRSRHAPRLEGGDDAQQARRHAMADQRRPHLHDLPPTRTRRRPLPDIPRRSQKPRLPDPADKRPHQPDDRTRHKSRRGLGPRSQPKRHGRGAPLWRPFHVSGC